jgi:hypothetical protein
MVVGATVGNENDVGIEQLEGAVDVAGSHGGQQPGEEVDLESPSRSGPLLP